MGEVYGGSGVCAGISGDRIYGDSALYPAAGESDRCPVAGLVDLLSDEGGAEFDSLRAVLRGHVDRDGHCRVGRIRTAAGVPWT